MKGKGFIETYFEFMADPEGLTREDLVAELKDYGINISRLEERVEAIIKKGSEERRLAWRNRARQKRAEIKKKIEAVRLAIGAANLKDEIRKILKEDYGQGALALAETYFRKKEDLSEQDLESLIEDLENLILLDNMDEEKG